MCPSSGLADRSDRGQNRAGQDEGVHAQLHTQCKNARRVDHIRDDHYEGSETLPNANAIRGRRGRFQGGPCY